MPHKRGSFIPLRIFIKPFRVQNKATNNFYFVRNQTTHFIISLIELQKYIIFIPI